MSVAVGSPNVLTFTTKDTSGALVDPTTVTVTITLPDGTTSTLTLAGGTVTRTSLGTFTAAYTTTQAGLHGWVVTTTTPSTTTIPDSFTVTATSSIPLVGLAEIREHLNLTSTASDAILTQLCHRASTKCERDTGIIWRRTAITGETHSGGDETIRLRKPFAQSITSVVENTNTLTASDYLLDPTGQFLIRGAMTWSWSWYTGNNNIVVSYIAGPPGGVVPEDILNGVREYIRHMWDVYRAGGGPVGTEWDPRQGFNVPRRVSEAWAKYALVGIS